MSLNADGLGVVGIVVYATGMHVDAIVLKTAHSKEHDRLAVLYTRQSGKLIAVARGTQRARSRQSPALDVANSIRCELIAGRAMPVIAGAHAVRCHASAKSTPIRCAAVHAVLQLVDAVVFDGQQDERLWDVILGALDALDTAQENNAVPLFRFWQSQLLDVLGYGIVPVSDGTVRCAADDRFEQIAGRRLSSLDLLYRMAERRF